MIKIKKIYLSGTAVGKLEGDPMTVPGYYNVCRELKNEVDLPRGIFFEQDWADLLKVMPGCIRRHPRGANALIA